MTRLRGRAGLAIVTLAALISPPHRVHAAPAAPVDLCKATFSGSLARGELAALVREVGELRVIESPPHDLVITWPAPVTLAAHHLQWESATIHATHYGLEAWDPGRNAYTLIYEVTSNQQAIVTHRFPPVTTDRVRFTVFSHPEHYYALILRKFQFTAP